MYMFLGSTPESITDGTVLRFDRLVKAYSDPMTEVYLLFYQATLQLFVNFNKLLQREDPIILIAGQMTTFLKKLFSKFVTIQAIRGASDITSINYSRECQLLGMYTKRDIECFLDLGLYVGMTTRQLLSKLERDGDISPGQVMVFYQAV